MIETDCSFYMDTRQVARCAVECPPGGAAVALPTRAGGLECLSTQTSSWNRALSALHHAADVFDIENADLDSWKQRHPQEWSNFDVLNFIYSLPRRFQDITLETLPGERFQNVHGPDLYRMTRENFIERDARHGDLIYKCVQQHLRDCGELQRSCSDQRLSPIIPDSWQQCVMQLPKPVEDVINSDSYYDSSREMDDIDSTDCTFNLMYDFDGVFTSPDVGRHHRPSTINLSSSTCDLKNLTINTHDNKPSYTDLSPAYVDRRSSINDLPFTSHVTAHASPTDEAGCRTMSESNAMKHKNKRRYVRRASCPDMTPSGRAREKCASGAKTGSSKRTEPGKGGHLWEFIRRLLRSSESDTERIIQWEDRNEGVFRIVNSKAVARLWGEQKDNRKTKMTYEKLSRALRWCRSDGFLASVPKDGRYPKKLCFRFGPKATNWRDDLL